jgi:type IV fimbrial biogenesis protein FimT
MRQAAGFTLIEALIVVALVSIIAAVSAPAVTTALEQYNVISASQQVASTIRAARMQAVATNTALRVRFDYPSAGRYQVVLNADGVTAVGEVQLLPDDISFVDGFTDLQFSTAGRLLNAGAANIVVTNGNAEHDKTITISTSGRVQL